jgi:ATP-binding protein involved in chromosome partitioning
MPSADQPASGPSIGEDVVKTALATVIDPTSGKDIVTMGMASRPVIRGGAIAFAIEVPDTASEDDKHTMEQLRLTAKSVVAAIDGVTEVTAVLTAARAPTGKPKPLATDTGGPGVPAGAAAPSTSAPPQSAPPPPAPPPSAQQSRSQPAAGVQIGGHPDPNMKASDMLVGVDKVIAVASGKGGVGKSTTAVNIALALKATGHAVGLLDADIYGPSMPRMMGISGQPQSPDGKQIIPMEKYGIEVMSIGFMIDPETPMIWRGPMVMGALEQMMRDVDWGSVAGKKNGEKGLDFVIVDMPPGTGDVALSLSQRVSVSGAVIVSTPQDVALIDAIKAINMFRKVNVPILGVIENMSHFSCPHCGERSDIFGTGGAAREAERMACDFLGEIPLDIEIRATSDSGEPVVAMAPDGPHAAAYLAIAAKVSDKLATLG